MVSLQCIVMDASKTNDSVDASKHYFEECMQSPLPHLIPLKVCAMLALANILSKSFLAFVYIGKSYSPNETRERGQWVNITLQT